MCDGPLQSLRANFNQTADLALPLHRRRSAFFLAIGRRENICRLPRHRTGALVAGRRVRIIFRDEQPTGTVREFCYQQAQHGQPTRPETDVAE